MKKWSILVAILILLLVAMPVMAKSGKAQGPKNTCATIQSGELLASTGETLTTGFDEFGYNYQAYMFNGRYCDYDRVLGGAYCDVNLIMKWNDAWLSNEDCDGDSLLDRHYGLGSYVDSGAWLTNHQRGVDNGKKWNYFTKIVAVPLDANVVGGVWYNADGTEIGSVIWGSFATIMSVYNDQGTGDHGIEYLSPAGPGFGKY